MFCKWNWTVCNILGLFPPTSLSAIPWRFNQVVACINKFFLLLSSILWIYQSLFNHSPTEGHLCSLQFGAIMNKAAYEHPWQPMHLTALLQSNKEWNLFLKDVNVRLKQYMNTVNSLREEIAQILAKM